MSRPSELSHRRSTGYASPGQGYPPDRRHRRADRVYQVDTRSLRGNALFRPLNGYASTQRHNFDGWMSSSSDNGLSNSYAQLFRDGSIETVDARMLHPEGRSIPIDLLETEVIDVVSKYLALLGQLGVDPPIVLMLTLMGVQGYTIPPPNAWGLKHPIPGRAAGACSGSGAPGPRRAARPTTCIRRHLASRWIPGLAELRRERHQASIGCRRPMIATCSRAAVIPALEVLV